MSDEVSKCASFSTAHATWDKRWTNAAGRADWLVPEPEVVQAVEFLKMRGAKRALDLGCGVGRHVRLLAAAGLEVHAADASASGLAYARAQELNGEVCWARSDFTALPFAPAVFDFALAWNVIYHGDQVIVARALAELGRVLRPGGLLQITMLSKRNALFGRGTAVAADTFVADTDDEEKRHPHYYCDAVRLLALLDAFEPLYLLDREQTKPGSYHWVVLAERRPF